MTPEIPENPVAPPSPLAAPKGFYDSAQKAYERVGNEFDHWTGKLTDTSLQMCYALIAANWVVFGSVGNILKSNWSKSSLLLVMLTLGSNLVGSWWVGSLHKEILDRADENPAQWESEFESAKGKDPVWPFTNKMFRIGIWTRWIKGALPLGGAILLLIGAIVNSGGQLKEPCP